MPAISKRMSARKFGVSTLVRSDERGDLYHNVPMSFDEVHSILISNGWDYVKAENALNELWESHGKDYIIVNDCCQIC